MSNTIAPFILQVQPVAIVSQAGVDMPIGVSGAGSLTVDIPAPPQRHTLRKLLISFVTEPPDGVLWQVSENGVVKLQGAIAEQQQTIELNYTTSSALTITLADAGTTAFVNVLIEVL